MSFQRENFKEYFIAQKNLNVGIYCFYLNKLEREFPYDIDAEYDRDQCESMSEYLDQKFDESKKTDRKLYDVLRQIRQGLRKYLEFRKAIANGYIPEIDSQPFIQPQEHVQEHDYDPESEDTMDSVTDIGLNTILYGPPGTGKTYHTVIYAVAIIENKKLSAVTKEKYDDVLERYNTYKAQGRIAFTTFHQSYGYEEFIEGIRPVVANEGNIQYHVEPGIFKKFCEKATQITLSKQQENYVFIIDEINRGNISKIFGELITLIEATKRVDLPEGMKAVLPYSQTPFGVPKNVYIIGTMNTADRSIATIDTALRRRFFFKEMMPQPDVLAGIYVEDVSVSDMLMRMNKRISVLYDREHTIGHAYFMPLKENPTIETLKQIFTNNIIPLLQEYFYEDYEKIRLVLGDNRKASEEYQFIISKENDYMDLFGDAEIGLDDEYNYEINDLAFDTLEAYRSI